MIGIYYPSQLEKCIFLHRNPPMAMWYHNYVPPNSIKTHVYSHIDTVYLIHACKHAKIHTDRHTDIHMSIAGDFGTKCTQVPSIVGGTCEQLSSTMEKSSKVPGHWQSQTDDPQVTSSHNISIHISFEYIYIYTQTFIYIYIYIYIWYIYTHKLLFT